ncbi:TPA: hypothetical protein N0F65_008971 [Lagenidium giganteum]|uniref:Ion transport domain-containing protein n=1 Tax=Lagenidium giganteum TaxID=4803 RepID=A0AAV2YYD1_9STRA|nr:TPA: hypothetical protein N0F65_008971 [Lagenidium giganteum]
MVAADASMRRQSESIGARTPKPSIEWRSLPDASFNNIVPKIILSAIPTLQALPSVFLKRESNGWTLLHVVCGWKNAHELVTLFLRANITAAQEGQIPSCKVLLKFGAKPNLTPIRAAAERGQVAVRYTGLARIYGPPSTPVDETALALAARSEHAREILSHRLMKYIMRAKWKIFGRATFRREIAAYCTLLASYALPTIAADPDWTHLANPSDYFVAVMRAISWLFSVLLLMTVERNEFLGGKIRTYFKSFWNVLSLFTYVLVLVTIPFEWMHTTTSKAARNSMLALINVSLWINLLPFLEEERAAHCHDEAHGQRCLPLSPAVRRFVLGFSCALFLLLQGQPGYERFLQSLITVYLLLFGQFTYDLFNQAEGWTRFMCNLLLFVHLMGVVVVLLNIRVARMATTYSDVWGFADGEAEQSHASSIISKERAMTAHERERRFQQALHPVPRRKKSTMLGRSGVVQPEGDQLGSSSQTRANAKQIVLSHITENIKAAPDERYPRRRSTGVGSH